MRTALVLALPAALVSLAAGAPPATPRHPPSLPGTIVDLTHSFDAETIYWPTAGSFVLESVAHGVTEKGYFYAANKFCAAEHGGTHLDAPVHFIERAPASEAIPLDAGMGPAWVVDAVALTGPAIEAADIASLSIPAGETRLLFKTRNSALWGEQGFQPSFIGLDHGASTALAERGVSLVGIDYLSVAPFGNAIESHRALLSAGVAILEGIDLREVEPGPVELLCLPIRLIGSDGAPARALVRPRTGSGGAAA